MDIDELARQAEALRDEANERAERWRRAARRGKAAAVATFVTSVLSVLLTLLVGTFSSNDNRPPRTTTTPPTSSTGTSLLPTTTLPASLPDHTLVALAEERAHAVARGDPDGVRRIDSAIRGYASEKTG